jgi:hypothetical protein
MQSNPEEFGVGSRWMRLVTDYESTFAPEDIKAFKEAYKAHQQSEFTGEVLSRLAGEKSEELELLNRLKQVREANPIPQIPSKDFLQPSVYDVSNDEEDMAEDGFTPAQIMAIKATKGRL